MTGSALRAAESKQGTTAFAEDNDSAADDTLASLARQGNPTAQYYVLLISQFAKLRPSRRMVSASY